MNAKEQFEAMVNDKVRDGMDRKKAVIATCRERPDLHEGYLLETNRKSAAAKIHDRFEMNRGHYGRHLRQSI